MMPSRLSAAASTLVVALFGSPSVADVISDWNSAVAPPPPELKEVTVDPSTTALLFLDIMKGNCTARPRCVAAMPNLKRLHDEARAHNMVVWYSLEHFSIRLGVARVCEISFAFFFGNPFEKSGDCSPKLLNSARLHFA